MLPIDIPVTFKHLGLSLLLGLLVGLQRQRAASPIAGLRTFALVTVLGTLCGFLSGDMGYWVAGAGFLGVAGCLITANIIKVKAALPDPGITTEIALLLMYAVGVYIPLGELAVAAAVGGGVAILLQFKPELHRLASRLDDEELKGLMKLVLIWFIILPILPDRGFGPFNVLNPHEIWWMVVLITSIGLAGYGCYKFLGNRTGTIIAGLLGGAVSSTATTAAYARQSKQHQDSERYAVVVILLATTVVYLRVFIEVAIVSNDLLEAVWIPLVIVGGVSLLVSILAYRISGKKSVSKIHPQNPPALKGAFAFALLYAVILVAVAAAQSHIGNEGVVVVAAISGLTDMDAITLSVAQMVQSQKMTPAQATPLIMLAALSNLVFKFLLVFWMGSRAVAKQIGVYYALSALPLVGALVWWFVF